VAHCLSATYDFNTGLLTSFTNENATAQASGNTPWDSAHPTGHSYDRMSRMTSAVSPPDPTNGNNQAQTTFSYTPPGVLPFTVTRTKSITPAMSDSATTIFDGLGRPIKTQHVTPGGTATADTVYDGLDHVGSVSNPYFSTSDTTYGVTQTQYDALGRATQVTKQDGSASTVAYNVQPILATPGDCTQSTDEAGKQRMACADGLGRLIEVHEPGDSFSGSQASGTIAISGALKSQSGVGAVGATTASAQVTISGNEQHKSAGSPPNVVIAYDTGKVYITINGHEYDYQFGGGDAPDTADSVAQGLVIAIQADGARLVNASVPSGGTVITLTAINAGSVGNLPFSTGYTWNSRVFSSPSFTASPASANLAGGTDAYSGVTVYDQGTVTVSVGSGFSATTSYSQSANSTAAAVASALVNDPNTGLNRSGSPVHATLSGASISITYNTVGTAGNVNVTSSSQSTQTQWTFSPPSFSGTNTTLNGGYNPEGPSLDFNYFVTQYAYDGLGNLVQVTQKGDPTISNASQWRVRNFSYDSLGRLLSANNPESGAISYSYDANSNLLQKTSPAPNAPAGSAATQTISYCYDELNRVTGRAYSAQSCANRLLPAGTAAVSYTYDSGANSKGRLTSLTDQAGSASYTYDVLGRMSGESRSIAGINKSMSYAYNLDNSLASLTYPSSAVVTYTPDSAGRMLSA